MFYCIGCIGNKHDLGMTEKTPMSSSVKDRQRLLSLDEIPHKRHARCQRSSNESPVKPPVGSPAYATAHQQYEIETAAKLKAEQDRRRQHKQASTEQKRQFSLAAEYQSQNVENSKFLRERERVLNLQGSDAGKANQSGDSFDIVTLAYHNSKGGRQLQHMDETIKYKAGLRTKFTFNNQHSVQHDIITGQPLVPNYIIPPKPSQM